MNRNNVGANTNITQMMWDFFWLVIAYLLTVLLARKYADGITNLYFLMVVSVFILIYLLSNKEARLYNVTLFFYFDRFFKIITKSWFISVVATALLLFAFDVEKDIRNMYFTYLICSYVLLCIDMIFSRFFSRMNSDKQAPRVAYVGYYEDYQKFNYFLNKTSIKVEQIGYITINDDEQHDGVVNVLGNIKDLEDIIRNCRVDQVFFMQKKEGSLLDFQEYIDLCLEMGVTAKLVIDSYVSRRSNSFVSSVGIYPVITYHTISLNNYEQMIKRIMDIVVSAVAIIISSPIMLFTAIAIKIDSPGPVIFRQTRVGQNGRNFSIFKFRSMYRDAEERKKELMAQNEMQGQMFKMKDDPRVTRVGKFIRKTSIDELPQLFNVLLGTMSLVGTRPPTLDEVEQYKRGQWRRISIKPGITGMWQVSGRNNITDFDKVVELDLKYIDNWSIWLDIRLLFKTVGVLFSRKGAY